MTIKFTHAQYIVPLESKLGVSPLTIEKAFTVAAQDEIFRDLFDPGFSSSIDFLEAALFFNLGVTTNPQNLTWLWQARELGGSSWVDLHVAVVDAVTGGDDVGIRVGLDAAALTADADSAPLEIRFLVTPADVSANPEVIKFSIGGGNDTPAIQIIGDST
jgi:hypothetical protein